MRNRYSSDLIQFHWVLICGPILMGVVAGVLVWWLDLDQPAEVVLSYMWLTLIAVCVVEVAERAIFIAYAIEPFETACLDCPPNLWTTNAARLHRIRHRGT